MAGVEAERNAYGMFERFLYIFLIPVLFTVILTIVLLTLFGYNVSNTILQVANRIPVIHQIIPDPEPKMSVTDSSTTQPLPNPEDIQALKSQIEQLKLEKSNGELTLQLRQAEIDVLNEQVIDLQQQLEDQAISREEYEQQINQVSKVYASMKPSRAAPVMENLTKSERVLMLSRMSTKEQVDILEKMNPQIAAETSIALKDIQQVKDLEIAALQERLQENDENTGDTFTKLQLSQTIAAMEAESATQLLLEMIGINESMVVEIVKNMNVQARSNILSIMSATAKEEAARITSKLAENEQS